MELYQIKYIAVKPNGQICGPVGDTEAFVKKSLIIGYKNAMQPWNTTDTEVWHEIKKIGYTIRKCKIYYEENEK